MMYVAMVLALLSADGTMEADDLLLRMENSIGRQKQRKAPPIPEWPEGLPDPLILQPGDELHLDVPATCYPYPTDFVLDYHLLQWETYPGRCQRQINLGWAAFEDYHKEAMAMVEAGIIVLPEEPEGFWQEWMTGVAITLAAVCGALLGYGAARLIHAR